MNVETWDSLAMPPGSWAAKEIAKLVPEGTPVVKVFNTTIAGTLGVQLTNRNVCNETGTLRSPLWPLGLRPRGGVERIGGDIWVEYPAWSPNGGKVAFMGQTWEGGDNYEIYVLNADGSGVRRLTDTPGSDGHPAWSPDGTMIAFNSERNNPGERGLGARIYVMNAD